MQRIWLPLIITTQKTDKDFTLLSKVAHLKAIYPATSIPTGVRVQVEFFFGV